MPIRGFMKTTSMPDTYLELFDIRINVQAPAISFTIAVWADDTKEQLIHSGTYHIDHSDPHWPQVRDFLIAQKPTWMNAIEQYLLTKLEYEDAVQESLP